MHESKNKVWCNMCVCCWGQVHVSLQDVTPVLSYDQGRKHGAKGYCAKENVRYLTNLLNKINSVSMSTLT